MSSHGTNQSYKQVTNVKRRTWDSETYDKKAKDRQQREQDRTSISDNAASDGLVRRNDEGVILQEEFVPAASSSAGPEGSQRAYLKARKQNVGGIDDKIGSTEIISIDAATISKTNRNEKTISKVKDEASVVQKVGVGWHCKVCDCFLKDSHTYLDHINGRKHQRALGYSMRVERASKEQIVGKLQQLTQQKFQNSQSTELHSMNFDDVVKKKDEEETLRKEERRRKRKERHQNVSKSSLQHLQTVVENRGDNKDDGQTSPVKDGCIGHLEEENDDEAQGEGLDPNIAAMMGFTDFGGSNRRH